MLLRRPGDRASTRTRWLRRGGLCALPSVSWALRFEIYRPSDLAIMLGVILSFSLGFAQCELRRRALLTASGGSQAWPSPFWNALHDAVALKIVVGACAALLGHVTINTRAPNLVLFFVRLLLDSSLALASDLYFGAAAVLLARALASDDSHGGILLSSVAQGTLVSLEILLFALVLAWRAKRKAAQLRA